MTTQNNNPADLPDDAGDLGLEEFRDDPEGAEERARQEEAARGGVDFPTEVEPFIPPGGRRGDDDDDDDDRPRGPSGEETAVITEEGERIPLSELPSADDRRERLEDERLDREQLSQRISRRRRLGLDDSDLLDPDEVRFTSRLDIEDDDALGDTLEVIPETRGEQQFRQGQEAALADMFGGGTEGERRARAERARFEAARREWSAGAFQRAIEFADVLDNAGVPEAEQPAQMEAFLERDFDSFVGARTDILTGDLPADKRREFALEVLRQDRRRDEFEAMPRVTGADGSTLSQSDFNSLTPAQQSVFRNGGFEALRNFTNTQNAAIARQDGTTGAFLPVVGGAGEPQPAGPVLPVATPEPANQTIVDQLRNSVKAALGIPQGSELSAAQEQQFRQTVAMFAPDIGVPGIEQRVIESVRTGEPVNVDLERGLTPIYGTITGAFDQAENFPSQNNLQRAIGIGSLTLSAVGDAFFVFGVGRGVGAIVRTGSNPTASFIASSGDEAAGLLQTTGRAGATTDIVIPAPRNDADIQEIITFIENISRNPDSIRAFGKVRLETPATAEGIEQLGKLDDALQRVEFQDLVTPQGGMRADALRESIVGNAEGVIIVDRALTGAEQAELADAVRLSGIRQVTVKQVARPASELDELNLQETARAIADQDKTRDFNQVLADLRGSFSTNTQIEDVSASALGLETRLSRGGIKTTNVFERIEPSDTVPSNIAREIVFDPSFDEGPARIAFGQGGPGLPGTPRGSQIPGDVSGQSGGVIVQSRPAPVGQSSGVGGTGQPPTRLSISSRTSSASPIIGVPAAPTVTGDSAPFPVGSTAPVPATTIFEGEQAGPVTFPQPQPEPAPFTGPEGTGFPGQFTTPTPGPGSIGSGQPVPAPQPPPQPQPVTPALPDDVPGDVPGDVTTDAPRPQPLDLPMPLAQPRISPSQGPIGEANPLDAPGPSPGGAPGDDPVSTPFIEPSPEPEPRPDPSPLSVPVATGQPPGTTDATIRQTPDVDIDDEEEPEELQPQASPLTQGFRVDLQDDEVSPDDDLFVTVNRETGDTRFSTDPVANVPTTGADENESLRTITSDDQEHPERIIQVGDRTYALNDRTLEQINELESEIGRPLTTREREIMALSERDGEAFEAISEQADRREDNAELDSIDESDDRGRDLRLGPVTIQARGATVNLRSTEDVELERQREADFPVIDRFNRRMKTRAKGLDPNRRLSRRFR